MRAAKRVIAEDRPLPECLTLANDLNLIPELHVPRHSHDGSDNEVRCACDEM
jgi:hypothetical protein